MEQNVGSTDAIVRIVVGAILGVVSLAILADYVEAAPILSPVLGVVALILLWTAFSRSCLIYSLLGTRTN